MARRPTTGPTERELEILQVLWQYGNSTVRQVKEHLAKESRISFSAVQTMLQIMYDKGFVNRELQGRTYAYWAVTSQEEAQSTLLSDLLERAFGGSAKALVSRALDVKRASPEELAEIQALLDEARCTSDD
ncbi:MAG: BlaI/MecI/CopY family transcriptional regulator [Trueperaceae bacterium]